MTRLGKFLIQEGILTASDQRMIRRDSWERHGSFARNVLALGLLDEDELCALFAARTSFRLVAKNIMAECDTSVRDMVPHHILVWLEALPLTLSEGTLTVALVDPTDQEVLHQLAFFSGLRIKPVIASRSEILRGLQEFGAIYNFGSSDLESFVKSHGRTTVTEVVPRKGAQKTKAKKRPESDYPESVASESLEPSFQSRPETKSETKVQREAPVAPKPVVEEITLDSPSVNLSDISLAAEAPDEPLDDGALGLAVDLPPELEEEGLSGDSSNKMFSDDVEVPELDLDFAESASESKPAAEAPAKNAMDDLDLGSLDEELDFDLDDEGNEIKKVKVNASVTTADPDLDLDPVIEVKADEGSLSDDLSASDFDMDQTKDEAVDLSPLEDEATEIKENLEVDTPLSISPLEDIALNDELVHEMQEASQSELPLSEEETVEIDSLELAEPLENLEDQSLSLEVDAPVAESPDILESGSDPGLDQLDLAPLQEDPMLEQPAEEMTFDPGLDEAAPASAQESQPAIGMESSATQGEELAGQVHAGVAVLNRALVQLQMTSDPHKILQRFADVSAKAQVFGGAVLKLKGQQLEPGILWHFQGGRLGSIVDLPGGIQGAAVAGLLSQIDLCNRWIRLEEFLGPQKDSFVKSWPAPNTVPNSVYIKTLSEGACVILLACFENHSDHEGIREAMGDLVRAVAPKIT